MLSGQNSLDVLVFTKKAESLIWFSVVLTAFYLRDTLILSLPLSPSAIIYGVEGDIKGTQKA